MMVLRFGIFAVLFHSLHSQTAYKKDGVADDVTTCNTSSAARGEKAQVTCQFPVDVISVKPVVLNVEFYPEGGNTTEILECRLYEGPYDNPCTVTDGYTLRGPVGSQLHLDITAMSEHHAGRYVCKMMTPRFPVTDVEPCVLELLPESESRPDKPNPAVELPDGRTSQREPEETDFPKEVGHEASTERPLDDQTIIIASLIMAGMLVTAAVVAIFLIGKRRKMPSETIGDADEELNSTKRKGNLAQRFWRNCLAAFLSRHGRREDGMPSGLESEFTRRNQIMDGEARLEDPLPPYEGSASTKPDQRALLAAEEVQVHQVPETSLDRISVAVKETYSSQDVTAEEEASDAGATVSAEPVEDPKEEGHRQDQGSLTVRSFTEQIQAAQAGMKMRVQQKVDKREHPYD